MAMTFDPFRELDRVAGPRRGLRQMPMDLYRDGDRYILNAELPGIDPGSVDVDVDGQQLTIRAEKNLRTTEGVKWLVRERQNGSFVRQLTLGQGIDTEAISAHYENGVLNVILPVSERAKPRKIAITEGPIQAEDSRPAAGSAAGSPAADLDAEAELNR
ncbi:Hsp20/alpha crystallin family protein [Saxibacter everestensis]|uniref:Hsp20/alpha crystallin family protein n=1 Tax=Saxibacter everestensis TaxID=2909229 RepID=A0ABY8QSK3_9MICO|nr:Hsp20/alpha crystallin family protein [Brevibacteriaceae bacterium ZFBP1038]